MKNVDKTSSKLLTEIRNKNKHLFTCPSLKQYLYSLKNPILETKLRSWWKNVEFFLHEMESQIFVVVSIILTEDMIPLGCLVFHWQLHKIVLFSSTTPAYFNINLTANHLSSVSSIHSPNRMAGAGLLKFSRKFLVLFRISDPHPRTQAGKTLLTLY